MQSPSWFSIFAGFLWRELDYSVLPMCVLHSILCLSHVIQTALKHLPVCLSNPSSARHQNDSLLNVTAGPLVHLWHRV